MNLEQSLTANIKLQIYPSKHLSVKCEDVTQEEFCGLPLRICCGKMLELMKSFEGVGLSANQVGIHKRIFVFENLSKDGIERPKDINIPDIFINPSITLDEDTKKIRYDEGCLSFPNIFTKVKRFDKFSMDFYDVYGNNHTLDSKICCGIFGHVFQHELDHLNGLTYLDKIDKIEFGKIHKKINKLRK